MHASKIPVEHSINLLNICVSKREVTSKSRIDQDRQWLTIKIQGSGFRSDRERALPTHVRLIRLANVCRYKFRFDELVILNSI